MKKHTKRALSLLLAVMLTFSLASFALADNGITVTGDGTAAVVTGQTIDAKFSESGCYVTLSVAADASYTGQVINWKLPNNSANAHFVDGNVSAYTTVTGKTGSVKLYLDSVTSAGIELRLGDLLYVNGTTGGTGTTYTLNISQDTAASVTMSPAATPISLGCGNTKDFTAAVTYTDNKSITGNAVTWVSGSENVAKFSTSGATGVLQASTTTTGKTVVKAVAINGTAASNEVEVDVVPAVSVKSDKSSIDEGGDATTLTATAAPAGSYTYSWSALPSAAVTITNADSSTATVTAASGLTAKTDVTITCKATPTAGGTEAGSGSYVISVYPKAASVDIYDSTGANKLTGQTINMTSNTMKLSYKTTPADSYGRGTASWSSDKTTVATVDSNGLVTAVKNANGTAMITCTYKNPGTSGTTVTAVCYVKIAAQTKAASSNVTMTASNHTDTNMTAAYNGIVSAYSAAYSGSTPSAAATITFNSISSVCGTLYKTSGSYASENIVSTGVEYAFSSVPNMVFSPNTVGTETITYTLASEGTGGFTINYLTGSIVITVKTTGSTIVVNLDGSDPYTFSYSTAKDGQSAAANIYSSIYSATGKSYYYLTFDAVSSAVGTLYSSESGSAVTANTRYYYSGTNPVSNLYFVPANSGTYTRSFKAYDNSNSGTPIFEGALQLVVPTKPAAADVSYSTPISSTLMMDETDFTNWYKSQTGQNYYLSSVKFDSAKYSNTSYPGYFQHNGKTFAPGNGVSYYTSTYNGTGNTGATYLSKVTYNSPIVSCYVTVNFTCYGGTLKSSEYLAKSGTMYICVTPNSVPDIKYTVNYGTSKGLAASDFVDVYKNAMNTNTVGSFYVDFINVPQLGSMTAGYVNASHPGVTLTSANVGSYSFYVNYTGSSYSIGDVSYVPGNYKNNTDFVKYAAYSVNGQLLYIGQINFVYGDGMTGDICYSDGYTFALSDFYNASDTDPVYYVTFTQPNTGALYSNYRYGSGTAVTKSMKFYTKYSAYGSGSVTSVTYIPPAGFTGSVSIPYTAVTASGRSASGSFVLSVVGKTYSAVFSDVTPSNTGSWSANSVDYANSWGLVSGTGTNTFSPKVYMNRGMMVSVLYRAAGSPNTAGTLPFTDVKYTDYYYRAVLWAYNNGIVSGKTANSFAPKDAVTREQFVTILYNYAAHFGGDMSYGGSLYGYRDASSVSAYARTPMQWAVYRGIISGTSANMLSPQGYANRAQAVCMLHRYLTV